MLHPLFLWDLSEHDISDIEDAVSLREGNLLTMITLITSTVAYLRLGQPVIDYAHETDSTHHIAHPRCKLGTALRGIRL